MGAKEGFRVSLKRETPLTVHPKERWDYKEIYEPFADEKLNHSAARCMGWLGSILPLADAHLGNAIPEFNDAVVQSIWEEAITNTSEHQIIPEFTGRICSCTL